jgi:2',3'-cyclic-nucleotide 2'-phosphodiesterase (5'-nucleotidase family)
MTLYKGDFMRIKRNILLGLMLSVLTLSGCTKKEAEVNVLATADLHGLVPEEMVDYVNKEREKNENLAIVDAGDFFDMKGKEMAEWFHGERYLGVNEETGESIVEVFAERREGEPPIVKDMAKLKYDAVVLGNHEFVSNDKTKLDELISYYKKYNMPILSANTYYPDGKSYAKPYIIKKIQTDYGPVNLGILGLTIKEVGERNDGSRELKDQYGFENKLYMNDMVKDSKKWVDEMKKDNADVIVAVVHSGEKPNKPKNPGNRIQEIAREVDGIDAIVASHTHKHFTQHDYENKSGENVIVTQPGKSGEYISKINFKLEKKNNDWKVIDKNSSLVEFK